MNQKQYQLMNLFTSSEKKKYTYAELADLLQLGKRSITNYINELNDFLSENGFEQIQLLPDNSFQLNVPLQELPKIRKKYFSRPLYEYHFSQEERVTIIKLLLCKHICLRLLFLTFTAWEDILFLRAKPKLTMQQWRQHGRPRRPHQEPP